MVILPSIFFVGGPALFSLPLDAFALNVSRPGLEPIHEPRHRHMTIVHEQEAGHCEDDPETR